MVSATKLQNFMQSSHPQPNIQEISYTFTEFFTNFAYPHFTFHGLLGCK